MDEVPEWKKTAQAMKQAADEKGVDFMTSPLSDITAALMRAVEIVETPKTTTTPLRGPLPET